MKVIKKEYILTGSKSTQRSYHRRSWLAWCSRHSAPIAGSSSSLCRQCRIDRRCSSPSSTTHRSSSTNAKCQVRSKSVKLFWSTYGSAVLRATRKRFNVLPAVFTERSFLDLAWSGHVLGLTVADLTVLTVAKSVQGTGSADQVREAVATHCFVDFNLK